MQPADFTIGLLYGDRIGAVCAVLPSPNSHPLTTSSRLLVGFFDEQS